MVESKKVTRADIPDVETIKSVALDALASGRARSFKSFEDEVAERLELSSQQKRYRISGSETTLFSNRCEKARSELRHEGLIEYPDTGKVKLTEEGKQRLHANETHEPDVAKTAQLPDAPPSVRSVRESSSLEGGVVAFPKPAERPSNRANLPLILAVIGLILCFTEVLAFAGVLCGIAALVLRYREKKTQGRVPSTSKVTPAMSICSIVLGLVIAVGVAGGGQAAVPDPSQTVADQQPSSVVQTVDDSTDQQKAQAEKEAAAKKAAQKEAEAKEAAEKEAARQKAEEEAAAQAAAEKKAAEEAAAKAAEEEKAAQAAAEKKAAEAAKAEAAAAAAAAAQSESSGGDTVYITNTGKKYHRDGCQHLKSSKIPIDRSEAELRYKPCKTCNP